MTTELSTVQRGELATVPPPRVQPSQRSDLATLLEAAIGTAEKPGLPADTIRTLVELAHIEADRRKQQEYNEAFSAFQRDCPMIPRTRVIDYETKAGGRVHYAYAPLDQILKVIQPHLDTHNLSRSWSSDEGMSKPGFMIVTCTIKHIGGGEGSAVAQGPVEIDSKMGAMKSTSAARTILQRASLIGALGLVNCDDDTDGNDGQGANIVPLSQDQVETLNNLCIEAKRKPETFARAYGATKLSEIPVKMFAPACDVLNMVIKSAARNP